MLSDDIEKISEEELLSLEANEIPESITLEFKRDLNLGDRKKKAEAAKDVSALANTVGGRICYGIDERDSPDGSVAGTGTYVGPKPEVRDQRLDRDRQELATKSRRRKRHHNR